MSEFEEALLIFYHLNSLHLLDAFYVLAGHQVGKGSYGGTSEGLETQKSE